MSNPGSESRVQTNCLIILSAVAGAFALYWLRPVLEPLVLAAVIAIALAPVVDAQVRHLRFPRRLAVATTLILGVLILFLLGLVVSRSINTLVANADTYKHRMEELWGRVSTVLHLDEQTLAGASDADTIPPATKPALDAPVKIVGQMLLSTSRAIMNILSNGFLILIFLCFLLAGSALAEGAPGGIGATIRDEIRRYIVIKVMLSAATGVLIGLVLWVLGVELALVFGLLAFLLNFIPTLGSVIATLLPLPVVVISPDVSPTAAVLAIALPACVQVGIGNVLEPRIMGRSLDLHPISIILALIFWGMLWGIVGMLLAVPMAAITRLLLSKTEIGAPLAALLGGHMPGARAEAQDAT